MTYRASVIILIIILTIGIYLRFYRINQLSTFLADQAIELAGARQILEGKYTLIGIKTSNSELHNGAVMYYILAPFLLVFKNHPLAGGVLQSILSILTIFAIFYIGRKFYNNNVGVIASFFIAASGLLVKFSRQTMLANYPLFFSAAFLLCLILFLKSKKSKTGLNIIIGILCGFMLQIHYSTIALLISALIFPFLFLKKKNILNYFFKLFFGFILGFMPMLVFEIRHQFFNTQMFFKLINSGTSLNTSFNLFVYWLKSLGAFFWGEYVILSLSVIGIVIWYIVRNRKKLSVLEKFSLSQIASTFIFTLIFVRENVPHYIINSIVGFAIIYAIVIYKISIQFLPRKNNYFLIFCCLLFLLINFKSYGLNDNHGWTMTKGWSLPQTEAAAKIIAGDCEGNFNVAMAVDYQNQGIPLRYFLANYKKFPLPETDYGNARFLYLVVQPNLELSQLRGMWEFDSFGDYNVAKIWKLDYGYLLYKLDKKA